MWEVQFAAGGRQIAPTFPLIDAGGRRPKANILGRCGGGGAPPTKQKQQKTNQFFRFVESQFFESQLFESQFFENKFFENQFFESQCFEGQFFGQPVL